ncbi:hypothetical protein DL93DRAFT_2172798 [Clavulina sp. PMI_390]|nr:hypothetical protein DL93DRAFT_2172798 [Clavulina sp. PMI_390]
MPDTEERQIEYHPEFNFDDAEVILRTDNGPRFKMYSLMLRRASGHFADVLALPTTRSPPSPSSTPREPILLHLPESNETIELMLRFVAYHPVPSEALASLPKFTRLVEAGVKYAMNGMLSILKTLALESTELRRNPLALYRLASLHGWNDVRRSLLLLCLSRNPSSEYVLNNLKEISVADYRDLVLLAKRRQDSLESRLNNPNCEINRRRLCRCSIAGCRGYYDDSTWQFFKLRLFDELRKCPNGNTINQVAIESWPETTALRNAYHVVPTIKQYAWQAEIWPLVHHGIGSLPSSL